MQDQDKEANREPAFGGSKPKENEPSPKPSEAPSAKSNWTGDASNKGQDKQLKDMGIGKDGGIREGSGGTSGGKSEGGGGTSGGGGNAPGDRGRNF